MTDFYTYIYHDGAVPLYVGKGHSERAYAHLKKTHNVHLKNKLAKMKREGKEPRIQIIDSPDEDTAFEMEELLIAMIGRRDLGTGPLLNLADGGKGGSKGFTNETREKMSAAKRGKKLSPEHCRKLSVILTGHECSQSTRDKIGNKHRGRKHTSGSIENMARAQRGKKRPIAAIEQTAVANRGKKRSQETRTQMSVSKSKPCTVDGNTIYPSRNALVAALGQGKAGCAHPQFRYITKKD